MDANYTIIGTDGLQYGPINLDQLKTWITEGRVAHETKISRSDTNAWLPAAQYAELGLTARPSTPVPAKSSTVVSDPALERRARSGARWFFWIAALSLVNTLMAMSSPGRAFLVGLGVTRVVDQFTGGAMTGVVLNVLISCMFAAFGIFAWKRQSWSFIVGAIFYSLDGLIFLLAQDWLGLGFHVFVLFWIFVGLKAVFQLNASKPGLATSAVTRQIQ